MTTREQDCLNQMRQLYADFDGYEIAQAIRIIRAELTQEDQRNALQQEILAKQAALDKLTQSK